jgi:hypothetical protein
LLVMLLVKSKGVENTPLQRKFWVRTLDFVGNDPLGRLGSLLLAALEDGSLGHGNHVFERCFLDKLGRFLLKRLVRAVFAQLAAVDAIYGAVDFGWSHGRRGPIGNNSKFGAVALTSL